MLTLREEDNLSDNFGPHLDEKSALERPDIEKNDIDLVDKSVDTRSRIREILSERIPHDGLLGSESFSSLRDVRFSKQEFTAGTPVSNIKYNHLRLQNNNSYYPFYNQLDYALVNYFTESEITKGNINKYLSEPLMTPPTKKLFYGNTNKWIEKLLEYHGVY